MGTSLPWCHSHLTTLTNVRGEFDETAFITFANDEANKNSYQAHQTTLTHGVSDRKLPRMIYLPYTLGMFAAIRPRTRYELFKEAVRLAEDPSVPISGEQILLIKEWCMGDSYKGSGN